MRATALFVQIADSSPAGVEDDGEKKEKETSKVCECVLLGGASLSLMGRDRQRAASDWTCSAGTQPSSATLWQLRRLRLDASLLFASAPHIKHCGQVWSHRAAMAHWRVCMQVAGKRCVYCCSACMHSFLFASQSMQRQSPDASRWARSTMKLPGRNGRSVQSGVRCIYRLWPTCCVFAKLCRMAGDPGFDVCSACLKCDPDLLTRARAIFDAHNAAQAAKQTAGQAARQPDAPYAAGAFPARQCVVRHELVCVSQEKVKERARARERARVGRVAPALGRIPGASSASTDGNPRVLGTKAGDGRRIGARLFAFALSLM